MHAPYFSAGHLSTLAKIASNDERDDSVSGIGIFSAAACSDADKVFAELPMVLAASGTERFGWKRS